MGVWLILADRLPHMVSGLKIIECRLSGLAAWNIMIPALLDDEVI